VNDRPAHSQFLKRWGAQPGGTSPEGPAELLQRAKKKGYKVLGITDHADPSNIDWVIPRIAKFCQEVSRVDKGIKVIPGVELTHCPPAEGGKANPGSRADHSGARSRGN